MRIASAFLTSIQWLVIAPRPKLVPSPGTVGECQILAWCSSQTTPSPRMSFVSR